MLRTAGCHCQGSILSAGFPLHAWQKQASRWPWSREPPPSCPHYLEIQNSHFCQVLLWHAAGENPHRKQAPSSKLSLPKLQTLTNDRRRLACKSWWLRLLGMRENTFLRHEGKYFFFNFPTIFPHVISHYFGKFCHNQQIKAPPQVSTLPNKFSIICCQHLNRQKCLWLSCIPGLILSSSKRAAAEHFDLPKSQEKIDDTTLMHLYSKASCYYYFYPMWLNSSEKGVLGLSTALWWKWIIFLKLDCSGASYIHRKWPIKKQLCLWLQLVERLGLWCSCGGRGWASPQGDLC